MNPQSTPLTPDYSTPQKCKLMNQKKKKTCPDQPGQQNETLSHLKKRTKKIQSKYEINKTETLTFFFFFMAHTTN